MKIYKVGGAIRDSLLGIKAKDNDYVVVGSTIEEMLALGFRPVGNSFPVFLHPTTNEEYALARTERKTGVGYKGFQFYASPQITLEEDLLRRDFTINAIAEDSTGKLIDPFGGISDLKNRLIKHVSSSFSEDPLRAIRAARFAATLEFKISVETMVEMQKIAKSGELKTLAKERITKEFIRAFGTNQPLYFLELLLNSFCLEQLSIELYHLINEPQSQKLLQNYQYYKVINYQLFIALLFHLNNNFIANFCFDHKSIKLSYNLNQLLKLLNNFHNPNKTLSAINLINRLSDSEILYHFIQIIAPQQIDLIDQLQQINNQLKTIDYLNLINQNKDLHPAQAIKLTQLKLINTFLIKKLS